MGCWYRWFQSMAETLVNSQPELFWKESKLRLPSTKMEALVTQLHVEMQKKRKFTGEIWEEVLRPWICISFAENRGKHGKIHQSTVLTWRFVCQGNQHPRGLGCADFAFPGWWKTSFHWKDVLRFWFVYVCIILTYLWKNYAHLPSASALSRYSWLFFQESPVGVGFAVPALLLATKMWPGIGCRWRERWSMIQRLGMAICTRNFLGKP